MPIVQEYPIIAVLGERGDGKTALTTKLGKLYTDEGLKLFANYTLFDIPYRKITFEELASFPDWLHNGVVLIDEAHIGVDSYDFLKGRVKNITKFVTQLRKRKLILYYTTQNFKLIAYRLRQQTDVIIECRRTEEVGIIEVRVLDYHDPDGLGGFTELNSFELDVRDIFDNYDTNEIIEIEE